MRPALSLLLLLSWAPLGAQESPFVDVTATSGVSFSHSTGAFGKKWLPETMGSGVVVFDANGDDRLDLLFLNGRDFPGQAGSAGKGATQKLYLNQGGTQGGLRFQDATVASGLAISAYCMGGAAGDLDNDGDRDLYLSCVGQDYLLLNDGRGKFRDSSAAAGLTRDYEFGVSVALFDADHDGDLDIYATRYVTWTPDKDLFCTLDGKTKSYCTPEAYPGASPRFYRNRGNATFEDRTKEAGLLAPKAKSLGVALLDLDNDGWQDLAVANDTQPNLLYRNKGDGSFEEIGVASGMAFSETGVARGGMGIDAADYDRSGRASLVIGNFANEMVALYRNEGNRLFLDVAPQSQVGRKTLLVLTFGALFLDYDLDGWLDLFFANGHLDPDIERVQPRVKFAQPSQLFRNQGKGNFVELPGGPFATPRVARAVATGDLDGDGDLDLVLTVNNGKAVVFENRSASRGHWLRLDLQGTKSNRDGLGARVEVTVAGATQTWLVRTGGSYLAQSETDPTFGLGPATKADKITVKWPSGTTTTLTDVAADRVVVVRE